MTQSEEKGISSGKCITVMERKADMFHQVLFHDFCAHQFASALQRMMAQRHQFAIDRQRQPGIIFFIQLSSSWNTVCSRWIRKLKFMPSYRSN